MLLLLLLLVLAKVKLIIRAGDLLVQLSASQPEQSEELFDTLKLLVRNVFRRVDCSASLITLEELSDFVHDLFSDLLHSCCDLGRF